MRDRVQKPFGLGADIGLTISRTRDSGATANGQSGWRVSGERDQPKSPLPRLGQVLLAVLVVGAMAVALHLFFH